MPDWVSGKKQKDEQGRPHNFTFKPNYGKKLASAGNEHWSEKPLRFKQE